MKNIILLISILIVGCGAAQDTTPPKKTLTCYDYESCRRACYSYDKSEACRALSYYK